MKVIWEGNLEGYGGRIFRLALRNNFDGIKHHEFYAIFEGATDLFGNNYWELGVNDELNNLIIVRSFSI